MKIKLSKIKTIVLKFASKFISKNSEVIFLIVLNKTGLSKEDLKDLEESKEVILKFMKHLKGS